MTSKQNSTSSTLTMLPIKSPTHNNPDQIDWGPSPSSPTPRRLSIDFSPPLIAMVVVVATAFFVVTYFRPISRHLLLPLFLRLKQCRVRWLQWRWRRPSTAGDIESRRSNFFDSSSSNAAYQYFSSHNGLDEEVIKTIPLSVYTKQKSKRDCAVCLVEFEENDYIRTLPVCSHAFHVDCIDIWLNSQANCPLCRTGVFRPESPFIPLMAARIRPSFDAIVLESRAIEPGDTPGTEIVEDPRTEEHRFSNHYHRRDFLLKRSYSFGFERNLGSSLSSDRIVMEAATATPWRYRRGSFWTKRPSPFNSLTKPRVFSFRSYRGGGGGGGMMKSPFFRRRSSGLFPLSESRRTKSMTSPMFMRSSSRMAPFSSSRLRCGDLEALLSPERLNRRWR